MPSLTKFGGIIHHAAAVEHDADANDEVWLLDNIAFRGSPDEQWQAEYVAAFFRENRAVREKIVTDIVALTRDLDIAPNDLVTKNRVRDRVAPFLREIGPHLVVKVQYEGSNEEFALDQSKTNGISSSLLHPVGVSDALPGQIRNVSVTTAEREGPQELSDTINLETGRTCFVQDGGWAVISDIDDTIKISEVRNREKLLQNTFTKVPSHVAGMPEFYQQLHTTLSTQQHPTPYAQFYKETAQKGLGGRVARIWIHKVVGVDPSAEKELNDPKRFEKAFEGIDKSVWKVFETPAELYSELEGLKAEVKGQTKSLVAESLVAASVVSASVASPGFLGKLWKDFTRKA
ncbi:hypothetical protein FRC19_005472 [Serendipita sp. 401]|nr:hypothetical protein FRC19_005472 [Serendipita sp. 401]